MNVNLVLRYVVVLDGRRILACAYICRTITLLLHFQHVHPSLMCVRGLTGGGEGYTNNKIWKHNIQYYIVSFRHTIRLSTSVRTECVLFYVFLILIFPWRVASFVDGVFFFWWGGGGGVSLFVRKISIRMKCFSLYM